MPIKSVLIVTHNIEEAVFMCDRILLLSSNPGRVIAEIKVPFSHPRNRLDPQFRRLVDDVYAKMTARPTDGNVKKGLKLGTRLPHVSTNLIAGLIETLAAAPYFGRADMPEIALSLHLEVDELFPIAEVLQSLGFADVREGDIFLTPPARAFADGDVQARKVLFAEHLLRYVPLAALIKNVLDERPGHRAARAFRAGAGGLAVGQRRQRDAGYGDQLGPLRRNILLQRSNGVFQPGGRRVLSEPALIGLAAQPLPQVSLSCDSSLSRRAHR